MNPNIRSTQPPGRPPDRPPDEVAELAAVLDRLAARDLDGLSDVVRAERVLVLRWLMDRLDGQWLRELAGVDARGAAGAEKGLEAGSTAGWLRARLRLAPGTATTAVKTARALFRGPLTHTAEALCDGDISAAHAEVVVHGTGDLPDHVRSEADPVMVDAARHLDPPQLRRLTGQLRQVVDPEGADAAAQRRHERRGLWLTPTFDQMVAVNGLLEPEAGQIVLAALEPLARPADANDTRSGGQRTADALCEVSRRQLEAGRLPITGGVRPQLSVVVALETLLGRPGSLGGDLGGFGSLEPEGCRRLACDGAVTRVVVTRQQPGSHPHRHASGAGAHGLAGWLRDAITRLPRILGGVPIQPLDVGRTRRAITAAQRHALAVRDGGCVFPGCSRPLVWCEAHHVWHWLDGGPTDLDNLVLLCRAHHRAMHEGGWQVHRDPDGGVTVTPPYRRHPSARRQPRVA